MNKEEINKKFNELSWEIEKFPASHLQTSICLMVAELRSYFSNYCDDVSDKYLLSVSEKAREILCARILELEKNVARYQKRDYVWRNKYALVQDNLAKAWETVEKQHNLRKQKEVNKMDNSFYMIERNSIPFDTEWFCLGTDRWTKNATKAIHFPCKESAREVWRAIMQIPDICFPYEDLSADGSYSYSYDVTSHGWIRCETQCTLGEREG